MHHHLIARALILSEQAGQTRVLLNEIPGVTLPFLPGGRVEIGEGVVQALERELAEELDLPCTIGRYLGAVEHRWPTDAPTDYEVNHVFRVTCPGIGEVIVPREADHHFFWCALTLLADTALQPPVLVPLIAAHVAGSTLPWWASTFA